MAEIIAEFFGIIGVDMIPPDNLAELMEGCRVKTGRRPLAQKFV